MLKVVLCTVSILTELEEPCHALRRFVYSEYSDYIVGTV